MKNVVGGFIRLNHVEDSTVYANKVYGCGATGSSVEVVNLSYRNHIDANGVDRFNGIAGSARLPGVEDCELNEACDDRRPERDGQRNGETLTG